MVTPESCGEAAPLGAGLEVDRLTALAATLLGLRVVLLRLAERTREGSLPALTDCVRESLRDAPAVRAVEDAGADANTANEGVRAYAAVPILLDGRVCAALCAVDPQPRAWAGRELGVLSSIAGALEASIQQQRAHRALAARHELVMAVIDSFDDALVVSEGEAELRLRNHVAVELLRSARAPEGRWHAVTAKPLEAPDGTPLGAFGVSHDVTETESLNQQVREQAELLRNLVHALPGSAVLVFDHHLRILGAEGPALATIGVPSDALVRCPLGETRLGARLEPLFRSALAGQAGEAELTLNGRVMLVRAAPLSSPDRAARRGMALLSDITDRHREAAALRQAKSQLEEQTKLLVEQSLTDNLTGLNNRRGFLALAEHALRSAQRDGLAQLLFFIDMDRMKEVNDRFGHDMGDRALLDTAAVLRATFRDADVLARLGGDEFVVLAAHAPEPSSLTLTERLQARLAEHNRQADRPFELSLSVGTAPYDPESPLTVEQLLAEADVAMYQHKRRRGLARSSQSLEQPKL